MLHEARPQSTSTEISAEEISALVRASQEKDTIAFARLIRTFEPKLHQHALFLTRHEQQALDLLQETAIHAWKSLHRYDGRAAFVTWMCSIMVHRHYDWLRRMRTRAFTIFTAAPDESVAHDAPSPSESAVQVENARLIRECLDDLPAPQRTVIYLRFYADESLEGIAVTLQCSVGTVKSRLFHALKRLAEMQKLKQVRNE